MQLMAQAVVLQFPFIDSLSNKCAFGPSNDTHLEEPTMTITYRVRQQFYEQAQTEEASNQCDPRQTQLIRIPQSRIQSRFALARCTTPHHQQSTSSSSSTPAVSSSYNQMWTAEEHERFLEALEVFPRGPWKYIAAYVGNKTARQAMSHAQKYRQKIERHKRGYRPRGRTRSDSSVSAGGRLGIVEGANDQQQHQRREREEGAQQNCQQKRLPRLSSLEQPVQVGTSPRSPSDKGSPVSPTEVSFPVSMGFRDLDKKSMIRAPLAPALHHHYYHQVQAPVAQHFPRAHPNHFAYQAPMTHFGGSPTDCLGRGCDQEGMMLHGMNEFLESLGDVEPFGQPKPAWNAIVNNEANMVFHGARAQGTNAMLLPLSHRC